MPKRSVTNPKTGDKIQDTVNKKLDIPKDIIRYQANKLLIMIRRIDRMSVTTPEKVDIPNYIKLLTEFSALIKLIKDTESEKNGVAKERKRVSTPEVGEDDPFS